MLDFKNFKKYIDQRFWKHIHKETLIPYKGSIPNRNQFLKQLYTDIEKMRYVPSPPRGYVVSHKQNLVVRFIPTLRREDYCLYFFCIKCLEDEIAKNRIKGTYGGWRLGGKIRKMENFDDAPSAPDNSYNKLAWKQAWTDYQKKAFLFHRNNRYNFFIVFDIANFYDSVRLRRLETLIREAVGKGKTHVVTLLFYFLSNWGKRDLNYERQNVGLPQDEVGDCSRILANFYLQNYDRTIYKVVSERNSGYLRYADDQIIASPDEKTAKEIMFIASKELTKLGLNLNASKAKFFNKDEFYTFWSFDIFKLLEDINDANKIREAWKLYTDRLNQNIKFKHDTVLKRLLNCNLNRIPIEVRDEILTAAKQKDFITNAKEYYLKRIYKFIERGQKKDFLQYLNELSDDILFNEYHLRIMKFAKDNKVDRKYLDKVNKNFLKIRDINQ